MPSGFPCRWLGGPRTRREIAWGPEFAIKLSGKLPIQ